MPEEQVADYFANGVPCAKARNPSMKNGISVVKREGGRLKMDKWLVLDSYRQERDWGPGAGDPEEPRDNQLWSADEAAASCDASPD